MGKTGTLGLFVVMVSASCGGGGGGSVAVSQIGDEMGEVLCARMFECCDAAELMDNLGFFDVETQAECESFYAGFVGGLLEPQIQASIDAGRLRYDGDRMGACLDLLASMSCGEFGLAFATDEPWGGCADPFEGLVAAGMPCANDMECASDYCDGDSTDFEGNVTEGTCGTLPGIGQACPDFDCASGAYCSFEQGEDICQATLSAGSECFSDDECASGNCAGDDNTGAAGMCSATPTCDGV